MRTVILVIRLADLTFQAGPNLRTNSNAVSKLDGRHLVADFDGMADDFMANAERKIRVSPSAGDGVDVTATHAAGFNLDIDVVFAKWLWFKLW